MCVYGVKEELYKLMHRSSTDTPITIQIVVLSVYSEVCLFFFFCTQTG